MTEDAQLRQAAKEADVVWVFALNVEEFERWANDRNMYILSGSMHSRLSRDLKFLYIPRYAGQRNLVMRLFTVPVILPGFSLTASPAVLRELHTLIEQIEDRSL